MLDVKALSFGFPNQPVLESVALQCARGEVIGIVGKSGSGKTTLLNLIAGYYSCAAGTIEIDGTTSSEAAHSQRIGYVFQTPTLVPWATAAGNVALPLQMAAARNGKGADWRRVHETLERAHIAHAHDKYPHELSGGMQTRVAIARAIVYRPDLLLLDEPFNGLDDVLKEQFIYPELQDLLAHEQVATVLVTHNLNEALLLCDRVYVLRAENGGGSSKIVHCETVSFPRPRTTDLYEAVPFMSARRRLREGLC